MLSSIGAQSLTASMFHLDPGAAYVDPTMMMASKKPPPGVNSSIVAYTFGPGALGIALEDAQGGTRVVVSEVTESSQAHRMGVPVGGTLMQVNGRTATGRRKAHVGKWLATEERPLTLQILHPGGAAAVLAAGSASADSVVDEFAIPAPSLKPTTSRPQQSASAPHGADESVSSSVLPATSGAMQKTSRASTSTESTVSPYMFGAGAMGLTLADSPHGVVVSSTSGAAEELNVPVGGLLIRVNADGVAGQSKLAVRKVIDKAPRPVTLMIRTTMTSSAPAMMDAGAGSVNAVTNDGALGGSTGGKSARGEKSRRGDMEKSARKHKTKSRKPKASSRVTPRPEKKQERLAAPKTFKFTFGPGPLGLGLSDAPSGGVVVSEVLQGSAASEQGVVVGGQVLQLNGMDVTNQGKVGLSKMIGYIPRPLAITLSPPLENEEATAHTGDAATAAAGAPAASISTATKSKPLKVPKSSSLKSGRTKAKQMATDDDVKLVAISSDDPDSGEVNTNDTLAETAPTPEAREDAAPEGAPVIPPPEEDADRDDDDDAEGSEDDINDIADAFAGEATSPALPTGAEAQIPEGGATTTSPAPAEASHASAQRLAEPKRAHPPPQAPVDAWPPWATTPPLRSPRIVVGGDAKYVLKNTREAFSHSSLAGTSGGE